MRRSFAFAALGAAMALVATGDACAPHDDAPVVAIGPSLVVPHGLLQTLTKLTVSEWPANPVTCDPPSGVVTNPNKSSAEATVALSQQGCTNGNVWCGSMQIPSSNADRIFGAQGADGSGNVVLVGCTKIQITQQSQPVPIVMRRALGMAMCGDMMVAPTEQCDPPDMSGGMVCDSNCQSQEELLSGPGNMPGPGPEGPGTAQLPALLWPPGASPAGRFMGFWQDKSQGTFRHIGFRVLGDDMNTLPNGSPPALLAGSLWMTSDPNAFPSQPDPNNQLAPSVAYDSSAKRTYVVFADDSPGNLDIQLRTLDVNFTAEQPTPIGVNGPNGAGETGTQNNPSIALGPGNKALVVWQDAQANGIVGRTFAYPSTYGPQVTLASGGGANPRVAALTNGWVVTWQDGSGIEMVTVDATVKPQGQPTNVSSGLSGTQAHPSVAALADNSFAVAWADDTNIAVQRYDSSGTAVAGDSTSAVNTAMDTPQTSPVIGGGNGFYVVAWIDSGSGHVRARLLDKTNGYDFNNVSGQNDDFQVSIVDGHSRTNPAVAVGGSGPGYIGIGWEDDSMGGGVLARRFPLPP